MLPGELQRGTLRSTDCAGAIRREERKFGRNQGMAHADQYFGGSNHGFEPPSCCRLYLKVIFDTSHSEQEPRKRTLSDTA